MTHQDRSYNAPHHFDQMIQARYSYIHPGVTSKSTKVTRSLATTPS